MLVGDVLVPPPPPPDEVVADVGAALPPVPTAVPVLPAVPFAAADGLAAPPLCGGRRRQDIGDRQPKAGNADADQKDHN